jgi:pyruvate dehydrogenase E2 component (dihydrolipoamide acetyltransferase)
MLDLKLPELGENIETAEISRLLVREGDVIKAGQSVLELESEKASFPLPCPSAGRVAKILVKEGDKVSIGQTVLQIEEGAGASSEAPKAKPPAEEKKQAKPSTAGKDREGEAPAEPRTREKPVEVAAAASTGSAGASPSRPAAKPHTDGVARKHRVAAGPATRKLARELGVDLSEVQGSERGGRITRDDVKAFVKRQLTTAPIAIGEGAAAPALPDFSQWGPVEKQRLNPIARTSAQRLSLAWRMAPHVTQHDLCDITDLEASRRRYNEAYGKTRPKITVTAIAIQAVVAALKMYPNFNSSLDPATYDLILKRYYHIGVAVDTDRGLLVPVVRDADTKSLSDLAGNLAELAEKARTRALGPKDMEGGTFTISNLGGIAGTYFTPIVNYPEVAILGIGRAWQQGERLMLPLSLSYDHRVINGADAARFIGKLGELLTSPFHLLAERK